MTRWKLAWRRGLRSVGWFIPMLGAAMIFGAILTTAGTTQISFLRLNTLEVVMPLVVGVQAAMLFAPDDEPPLELMLSKPRPIQWVLYERLAVLVLIYGIIGVMGSLLVTLLPNPEPLRLTLLRWLPPTMCMIGVGLWVSASARRVSQGVFIAVMLCAAMAVGQSLFLPKYDFMAWVMFYVQPWDVSPERYLANRIIVALIGFVAFMLTLLRLRDTERLLGTNQAVTP